MKATKGWRVAVLVSVTMTAIGVVSAQNAMIPFDGTNVPLKSSPPFFTGTIHLIPEPTTWALLAAGGGILSAIQRVRRRYH